MRMTSRRLDKIQRCKPCRKGEEGMALIFAMMSIIIIAGALALIMTRVKSNSKETDNAVDIVAVEEAAQAGVDYAVDKLWNDYIKGNGNTTGNWASYKFYLNNTLSVPINEDLNFNGVKDPNETGNDGTFNTYPAGYDHRGKSLLATPLVLKKPNTNIALATIDSVHVARYDDPFGSYLTVRSTATVNGKSKTAVQLLNIGGAELKHTQFAILANNISCIMCHAEFKSVNMENNTDPTQYNSFDRIKIAALQSMMVRDGSAGDADSDVAGTTYTRGKVYHADNTLYTPAQLAASTFKNYAFNNTTGKLTQDSGGNMTLTSVANTATNSNGELNQFGSLYMNYPTDPDKQTDGPLPNSFPAPYPDDNNNRKVDDAEFSVIAQTANGRISFDSSVAGASGSVQGGVAYGVPNGSVYAGTDLPTASTQEALDQLNTGSYDGNLILVGTDADPIQIHNSVAVNGDLVIKGPIKGEGQLLVRGNTYIVGDVTYADDPGEFGKYDTATGSPKDNAFALVSGGNVMVGDYLTVRGVNYSNTNNDKFPDWTQYSIHMRNQHMTNSKTVSGATETLQWGYNDPWSVDSGGTVAGRPGQQYSFTTAEQMLFNKLEVDKAAADPNYTPRFYGLRESQPNNIYVYNANDEHAVRYTDSGVLTLSQYLAAHSLPADIATRATYQYTSPKSGWMSESALRTMWYNDELSRPSSGRDFKFDGLMYSNNSIFALVRSKTRHNSNSNGQMQIRGGVIAADLGIFVPGNGSTRGLNLFYDPRVERFLEVRDTTQVNFTRKAFYFEDSSNGTALS